MRTRTLATVFLLLMTVGLSFGAAINPCPQAKADPGGAISGSSNTLYQTNVPTQGTCNIIITFNANGSIVTNFANMAPYDGVEDQLIGIINNSTGPITSIHLSNPGVGIFNFETTVSSGTDGICAYAPFPSNSQPCNNGDPISGTYLGNASSFSGINGAHDTGNVNFTGIGTGGTGYFSLEQPASLNLQVTPGGVPEPGTLSMALAGLAAATLVRLRRRRANRC